MSIEFKQKLINTCLEIIQEKLSNLDSELDIIQQSANEETKSSAGDKYETGRAMLMLEKEKFLGQKEQLFNQIKPLKSIDPRKKCNKVELGSIVSTSGSTYFIAAGIGEVVVENETILVISALAPIAQRMLDGAEGEEFEFNKTRFTIISVA